MSEVSKSIHSEALISCHMMLIWTHQLADKNHAELIRRQALIKGELEKLTTLFLSVEKEILTLTRSFVDQSLTDRNELLFDDLLNRHYHVDSLAEGIITECDALLHAVAAIKVGVHDDEVASPSATEIQKIFKLAAIVTAKISDMENKVSRYLGKSRRIAFTP